MQLPMVLPAFMQFVDPISHAALEWLGTKYAVQDYDTQAHVQDKQATFEEHRVSVG